MKKKPDISVIVTAHNNATSLPHCLTALMQQTWKNLEIIVIDDCSTDKSFSIAKKLTEKDARVHCIHNDKNLGVSASRNRGIETATAPLIMFCDADDFYEPTMCEEMRNAIIRNQADMAICAINIIYKAHHEMKPSDDNYYALKFDGKQRTRSHLIFNTDLAVTNKIFRKSLLEEFNLSFPEGYRFEDAYFCVAYLCCSQTVYFLNKLLYNYVRHDGSIMSQAWSKNSQNDYAIDHLRIAFLLFDFLNQYDLLERYNNLFWCLFATFENFAICNSKSRSRIKQVRSEARNFVSQHKTSFTRATTAEQEHVKHLNRNGYYISMARVKKVLLKFMPTYRLSIDNIHKMRTLKNRCDYTAKRLDEYIAETTGHQF